MIFNIVLTYTKVPFSRCSRSRRIDDLSDSVPVTERKKTFRSNFSSPKKYVFGKTLFWNKAAPSFFFNNMLKNVTNSNYVHNPPSYFNATYPWLKAAAKLKPFRAAIKMYYLSNIVSKVNVIPSNEWQITTFMPLEKFKKASREDVWKWANKYSK